MAKLKKTITINAPVGKVFGYWQEPANLPEIWPSMVEVKDVKPLSNGGYSFRYVYKMAGMRLKGTSEDTEYVPNQRTVNKSKGGIQATQTFIYQAEAGGTKLTWEIEYTVPVPLLGKLAEAVIVKMNEREAELVLANLKARMEA
jgi:uncharacterized membrane protein